MSQESAPIHNRPTDFSQLAESIQTIDEQLKSRVAKAVNLSLTLRNWLIGFYIHEYEQHGNDRAQYGDRLIETLAGQLGNFGVSRSEARELRRYRLFYQTYPQIWETLSPEFRNPPIGILLCTEKDHALVKYALAGMDNSLFVSRYQLELPSQEVLQQKLAAERQQLEGTE